MRKASPLLALIAGVTAGGIAAAGPLVDAAERGDAAMVLELLEADADPNDASADGTTALHFAVHREDVEMAAALIDAGASVDRPNRYGVRPLYLAAQNGDAEAVRLLLRHRADPNGALPEGETALMTAARTGSRYPAFPTRALPRWQGSMCGLSTRCVTPRTPAISA